MATCNPWRPLKVRPGRLAGGPPKGPTVSGHRLMTAKFAPEDILKPRNPAIPPQRRCFSSKSCFFFLRRRAHRRQTTVFTTPKRVLTSVFSVFALLNQPRFAFQPASFHFIQFQKISRFHSNPQGPSLPSRLSTHSLQESLAHRQRVGPGLATRVGPGARSSAPSCGQGVDAGRRG